MVTLLKALLVYLGDAEATTTDAGGQYTFSDVAVTNVVSGVNNEGNENDDNITGALIVTIAGTDAYLGALVSVTPQAQVNNTGGTGAVNGSNSDTTIQTFVDGFTVQAGTATLPLLNAGTYGYVRDCRTGQALLDTADLLSLDFVSSSDDVSVGSQLTNSEHHATIGSDANGEFSLANLAANSTYTVTAKQGWKITSGLGLANTTKTTVTAAADTGPDSTNTTTTTVVTGNTTVVTVTTVVVVDATDIATTTVVATTTTVNSISTSSENSSEFLGTIEVCPVKFVAVDLSAAPMITAIDGQIGNTTIGNIGTLTSDFGTSTTSLAQYAALNQGIVNDFVIHFSEEMASAFDMSEARVKVGGVSISDATVTLSTDGKSVTVTFVDDLDEGSKVDVWFPHWTALDANDALFLVDNTGIKFDVVALAITGQAKASYSHAYFCTFSKPGNEASLTLAPQVFDADTTEDGGSADLAGYSTAFQDNYDNTAGLITQLNDGDAFTDNRLQALAVARGATSVTVDSDYAVVKFDATNAASVTWKHGTSTVIPAPAPTGMTATTGYTIVGTGANTELHITPAAHGDVIKATPSNGFGDVIASGAVSVTLVDAIAPTTVLQQGYEITSSTLTGAPYAGLNVVSGATSNASFGSGGEISAPGTTATAAGEPILYIQPRHLAGKDGATADREEEFDTLVSGMSGRLSTAELAAYATPALALAATSIYTDSSTTHQSPIYDATAYSAWEATSATIGVAFSEDVTLTTTSPAYDGTSSLVGNYAVNNDVALTIDGTASNVDLITFETSDVVALSLDAGANLGFVGSVTDGSARGNVSTANAQVFIQDAFPPMMTAAVWNGDTLKLTFNETPVIPSPAANIKVIDPTSTVASALTILVGSTTASVAGNVMTISLTSAQNIAMNSRFVNGVANEFLYDDDADANEEQHALIDWDVIADTTGNSWSDFNSITSLSNVGLEGTPSLTNRWEVVAPRFLAVDSVGAFGYALATTLYLDSTANGSDDNGVVRYAITFTHPVNLNNSTVFGSALQTAASTTYSSDVLVAGAVSLSTADAEGTAAMNALFTVDLDLGNTGDTGIFVIDSTTIANSEQATGSFTISADHTVITLTLKADNVITAISFGGTNATTFGLKTVTQSAITSALQGSTPNIPWQNVN